jgi:hypothetical protein
VVAGRLGCEKAGGGPGTLRLNEQCVRRRLRFRRRSLSRSVNVDGDFRYPEKSIGAAPRLAIERASTGRVVAQQQLAYRFPEQNLRMALRPVTRTSWSS